MTVNNKQWTKYLGLPEQLHCSVSSTESICLASSVWCRELVTSGKIPHWTHVLPTLTLDELHCAVCERRAPDASWLLLNIQFIRKPETGKLSCPPLLSILESGYPTGSTYSALLRQVAQESFAASWQYHSENTDYTPPYGVGCYQSSVVTSSADVIREYLLRAYSAPLISVGSSKGSRQVPATGCKQDVDPSLQEALAIIETDEGFLVLSRYPRFRLSECAAFSSAMLLQNSAKALFVGYQLLRAAAALHSRGVPLGDARANDAAVDERLWVRVRPRLDSSIYQTPAAADERHREKEQKRDRYSDAERHSAETADLSWLTHAWVSRRISNLVYLLGLNRLAGRRFDDPGHHPVVPWVTDLTCLGSPTGRQLTTSHGSDITPSADQLTDDITPSADQLTDDITPSADQLTDDVTPSADQLTDDVTPSHWRLLDRSKYRLNKGDQQLDVQYQVATAHGQPAHHISDVLSEITYYVYLARRTPRSVLCQHVRAQWVPDEYPSSMARLYQWTPDECIPQFYTEPSIFKSIHADMPDLQLPDWADSAASFISGHRAALESHQVSSHLHHWIDLTFGYKLTGRAAVMAKNVCRHLVEPSTTFRRNGVLQLFNTPHPVRQVALPYFIKTPPDLQQLMTAAKTDESQKSGSSVSSESMTSSMASDGVILLPRDFEPMSALRAVENLHQFTASSGHPQRGQTTDQVNQGRSSCRDPTFLMQCRMSGDAAACVCLFIELCLPLPFRRLCPDSSTLSQRLHSARDALDSAQSPLFLRALRPLIVQMLHIELCLKPDVIDDLTKCRCSGESADDGGAIYSAPFPTVQRLLEPALSCIPFPDYMPALYTAAAQFEVHRSDHQMAVAQHGLGSSEELLAAETWVDDLSASVLPLLPILADSAIYIVIPLLVQLLETPAAAPLAAWRLFSPLSERLSRQLALSHFLQPLLALYMSENLSSKSMKLFHRSFLVHLSARFGQTSFLHHFTPALVEALGGQMTGRECAGSRECARRRESAGSRRTSSAHRKLSQSKSDSANQIDATVDLGGDEDDVILRTNAGKSSKSDENSLEKRRNICDSNTRYRCHVSDVAAESVMWLAHRLGPLLTSQHLTKTLLRMLSICYSTPSAFTPCVLPSGSPDKGLYSVYRHGDASSAKVLLCLCNIAELYGEPFIIRQYLPHVLEVCAAVARKLTPSLEPALMAALTLLIHVLPYLNDTTLMDLIQESLITDVIEPSLKVIVDSSMNFPSGWTGRAAVTFRWVRLVVMVTHRVGLEMSHKLLSDVVNQLTAAFPHTQPSKPAPDGSQECGDPVRDNIQEEMRHVFSPALADAVYRPLCHLLSVLCTTSSAAAHLELIRHLCSLHRQNTEGGCSDVSRDGSTVVTGQERPVSAGSTGFVAQGMGNRIQIQTDGGVCGTSGADINDVASASSVGVAPSASWSNQIYKQMSSTTRQLSGAWLAYWRSELNPVDRHLTPRQVRLQSFEGHTAAVREMCVLDSENSFISASKDRTVKLWSLRSQGDGGFRSAAQWTYTQHKRPLFDVVYLAAAQRAISCDAQSLHVWDPYMGTAEAVIESLGSLQTLCQLSSPSRYLLVGTAECSVKLLDLRTMKIGADWKTLPGAGGGRLTCMTSSDDVTSRGWTAIGHSNGGVTLLDSRTGGVVVSWRAHDTEVVRMCCVGGSLVTSSADHTITVWSCVDGKPTGHLKGVAEPVTSLISDRGDVITGTSANRVSVHSVSANHVTGHSVQDGSAALSSTKLTQDCCKGVLSCMSLLRANRLLLLGSDNGSIRLIY